ncbi:MAG: TSUP family transporter [Deltaproteobacteria bacterium]
MAGGLILLSALLVKLDPVVAVPVHGIVQLVSNASRAWFLRQHVNWRAVLRFDWPLMPAGALGLLLLQRMPAAAGRISLGLFVLVATWLPQVHAQRGRLPARVVRAARRGSAGGFLLHAGGRHGAAARALHRRAGAAPSPNQLREVPSSKAAEPGNSPAP